MNVNRDIRISGAGIASLTLARRQTEVQNLAKSFVPDNERSIRLLYLFLKLTFLPGFRAVFRREIGTGSIIHCVEQRRTAMIDQPWWSSEHVTGLVLVLGSVAALPGLMMFWVRGGHRGGAPRSRAHFVWE
jgi:hypothetical protein